MSKITLRSPYETWRGKDQAEGGNVLYPVNGRMFARPNFIPENPKSELQTFTRISLASVSQAFSSLTPSELQSWEDQAQNYSRTDLDGESYKPGAKALFVSVNWYRALAGLTIIGAAPVLTGPVTTISNIALTLNADENQFTLTSSSTDGVLILEASAPLPGAVRKAVESDYRLINISDSTANIQTALAGPMTFSASAAARRYIYQPGDRVGVRINILTSNYVQKSAQTFEVIVA